AETVPLGSRCIFPSRKGATGGSSSDSLHTAGRQRVRVKSSIRTIANLAISVAILAVLLTRVDYAALGRLLLTGSLPLFLTAYALMWLTHIGQTARWHYLSFVDRDDTAFFGGYLRRVFVQKEMRRRFMALLRFHIIGNYFQLFLPSAASGDVVKGYFSVRKTQNKGAALSAIVVGRVLGISCALAIAVTAVWLVRDAETRAAVFRSPALWIAAAGLAALIAVLLHLRALLHMDIRPIAWLKRNRVGRVMVETAHSLGMFRERKRLIAGGLLLSVLIQLLTVLTSYTVFVGLGWSAELAVLTVYLPLIYLFTMLPISFNGMGVRESLLMYFLADYGCTDELVIGYAVVGYGMVFSIGLVGWVLYVTDRRKGAPSPAPDAAAG
ncbi:MAG: hypothetical protein GF331_13095, partial [Chitinivibrionales bacterium]|nr:hypothetical protein [Chitinivibrionales bacterium]